jgi:general secretion pathway protein G
MGTMPRERPARRRLFRRSSPGFTFLELVVVTAIMMIMATAALPLARVSMKRQKEAELRRSLREMRQAMDTFKLWADRRQIAASDLVFGCDNYPASLEVLVNGVLLANDATGNRKKFLRRIPIDPMTGSTDWGKRSYMDNPDAKVWGGQCVFDVYSKYEGTALDGSKYRDW